jgi:hypothetical protein
MTELLTKVLNDILYYATRQVIKDHKVNYILRKSSDVVYCQVEDDYHTFSLNMNDEGLYNVHHLIQSYSGDIKDEDNLIFTKEYSRVVDLMDYLYYHLINYSELKKCSKEYDMENDYDPEKDYNPTFEECIDEINSLFNDGYITEIDKDYLIKIQLLKQQKLIK